jgi:fibronectin-binding autotransporter adhesin
VATPQKIKYQPDKIMRQPFNLCRILAVAAVYALLAPSAMRAANLTKANDTNSLDQGVSWVGGTAPGSADMANWSGTYSADTTAFTTNSLKVVMPASALSWQGINVGTLAGSALTVNTISAAATNLTAVTEGLYAATGLTNLVTVTTKAAHAFAPGQAVTLAGITPDGYNGTFIIIGVPSSTTFTVTNPAVGLTAGTAFGTVQSSIYIGGSGAATAGSALTIGTSGIDLSAANVSANLNAANFAFNGNQTWNTARGNVIHFGASGTGGANAVAINSGNDGIITIVGGGVADLNEAGDAAFADATSFLGFDGSWVIDSGATLRGLRDGPEAFGSNTATNAITLDGGTLAVGGISGDVGSWTWNTPITLAAGVTSFIDEQNVTGTGRYLKLNQVITGSGNLTFLDTANGAASTFTSQDLGYILVGANNFTGTLTIGGPVENGIAGRLTPVRIGGSLNLPTDNTTGPGTAGSLGTGNIVNNGVLTFSFVDGVSVPNPISGTGTLRIGSLASALYPGTFLQSVTLLGTNTYTGPTIINAGTLLIGNTGSISNSATITVLTNTTFDVSALPNGFTTSPGQTLNLLGGSVNGSLNFAAESTNLIVPGGSNVVGTLSINGDLNLSGGANTVLLDINNSGNDQISVSGNLVASGVTTLQLVPPTLGVGAGTYTLITVSGTITATPANFNISGVTSGGRSQAFNIVINGNSIQLVVVGSPANLTWVGDGINNLWNTETTSNWFNTTTSAKDVFYAGDLVTFDDTGSATPAINLVGVLKPGSITLNNSVNNYTFGGAGQIAGSATLTMNGSGLLAINTSNSFTGGELLNSGILAITNEAALGEPTNSAYNSLTLNGGALLVTNTLTMGANTNRGIDLGTASETGGGSGTFMVTNGATLTVSNVISDDFGLSVLTESGNGTLILDGVNNYGGGTIINGGTVVCGSAHALGLSGSWSPGFTLQQGTVDINGQGNYGNASIGVSNNFLFNGVFITFAGAPGAGMNLIDSTPGHAGFGVNGTALVNDVITYNGANNPGKAIISAPWYAVGTGAAVRTCVVEVDPTTATNVGLEFQGQLSSLSYEGKVAIIQKTGNGVMEISSTNDFPNLQVTAGTLLVNNAFALGADRSPDYNGVGTGSPHQLIVDGGTVDLNGFSPAIGALSDNGGITSGVILNDGPSVSTLTLGYSASNEVNNASYAGVIADGVNPVSIVKIGTNTQVLAGLDTYSGPTIVNNGILLVNGQIGLGTSGSTLTVTSGVLGGSGTINAPVVVQSGGTLSPGAGAAGTVTLTVATNLTLGGTNIMNVDEDTATNDLIVLPNGTINYGGTLVISTNFMQSTVLTLGDSFQLFNAPAHTGNFSSISGSPGAGLSWSFNPASGVVSVVGFVPQPAITGISLSGTSLVLTGTNGQAGEQYNVLTTTNLALPLSQWTVLSTNTFSAGNFSITNSLNPNTPQSFYILRVPQN